MAFFILGRWSDAIEHAEHALGLRPAYWYAHVIKISALTRSGDPARAEVAMSELLRTKPKFTKAYLEWIPFLDKKWTDYLMEGLPDIPLVPIEFLTADGQSASA